jgi:hypothetical protein
MELTQVWLPGSMPVWVGRWDLKEWVVGVRK